MIKNSTKGGTEATSRVGAAVVFENANKKFTVRRSADITVLKNFNMNIPQGAIYTLLGSSGCGKTTILSLIVALRKLDSGTVKVFGRKPGNNSQQIGYMPQELSLYGEFTISETFYYFGTIFSMNQKEISDSLAFFTTILDLPDATRRVHTLSGGTKRRVSLSCSLLHNPPLLILDEPSVGVDPVLRKSIWNYLIQLVASKGTTVLITTHYVEEARNSHMVGVLRNGRMLVEKSPTALMEMYNLSLLEDVVLKLCELDGFSANHDGNDDNKSTETDEVVTNTSQSDNSDESSNSKKTSNDIRNISNFRASSFRLKALVQRNICLSIRNFPYLLFVLFLPAIQMICLCLTIGNPPKPLKLGLVNNDEGICNLTDIYEGCMSSGLSCKYLQSLPSDTINLVTYENEILATDGVKRGDVWGFITFPKNFSKFMLDRFVSGNYASNETLDGSTIFFDLDLSNVQIGLSMKKVFYDSLSYFIKDILKDCDYDSKLGDPPIKFRTPIYGEEDSTFLEFTGPSTLLGILFFFPICSSAVRLILDKKQGTWDRSLVAGVKPWETMTSFFFTEGVVLIIQSGLSFIVLTLVFSIEIKGSIILAIFLSILVGVSGLSLGFLFASFCNDILEAIVLAMGSFFPNFLLSGMIWPIQGMPIVLQYVSYVLPCTLACESLRSIISRGWGLDHIHVFPGFLSTFFWICLYWTLNIMVQRAKK